MLRSLIIYVLLVLSIFSMEAQNTLLLNAVEIQQEGDTISYPTTLPATVQKTLEEQGIIPDHFIGMNEEKIQWVSDQNWLFKSSFTLDDTALQRAKEWVLQLSGVDTYAEVYLNGSVIGQCNNFFKTYDFKVKPFLRSGKNYLVIRLLSPTRVAHAQYASNGFNYPADNDRYHIHYSPFVRTAPFHFGWDWGPRVITLGIDAPIKLSPVYGVINTAYAVTTFLEGKQKARVQMGIETTASDREKGSIDLQVISPKGRVLASSQLPLSSKISTSFNISNPMLWMPRGYGEPHLYQLITTIRQEGYIQRDTVSFGIRDIVLEQKKDNIGESFTFKVNGVPIYAKGANYLPHDRRFRRGRSLDDLFKEDLLPAHFNMLRVWGGGIYETEEFYRLADKYGILIWQDLPFACTTYPYDPIFKENIQTEITQQIKRLRLHPSLALICGNNEILEGLKHWGWKKKYQYTDVVWNEMFDNYEQLFKKDLPALIHQIAPNVAYIHGSPLSSNWGRPESLASGDNHYWGVWFGGEDFTTFDAHAGRFSSEFGFQAFPEMKCIQSFAPNSSLDSLTIDSPILQHRQRSFIGNERISDYMKRQYPVPDRFSDYVYVGQLLQGYGIGYAIRAIRRAYPMNSGVLYWQLNDVWPTVSWSSIDYWGNKKALHYQVQRAYAPTTVDIIPAPKNNRKNDLYSLMLVSDDLNLMGNLSIQVVASNFEGKTLWKRQYLHQVTQLPFSSKVAEISDLPKENREQMVLQMTVTDQNGQVKARQLFYPRLPKELILPKPNIKTTLKATDGMLTLTLSSDKLVKDLFIETPWQGAIYSDNYFDLLPNETKIVQVRHPEISPDTTVNDLHFKTLYDILSTYDNN